MIPSAPIYLLSFKSESINSYLPAWQTYSFSKFGLLDSPYYYHAKY